MKLTESGVVPLRISVVMMAFNSGVVPLGVAKAKGDDCGLSVPSLKVAVNVKLVLAALKVT